MFLREQTKQEKKREVTDDEPCPDDGPSNDDNMFDSDRTETLSCPSQKLWLSSQVADSESDSERNEKVVGDLLIESDNVEIDKGLFDSTEKRCDINREILLLRIKCREKFKDGSLITDADKFKKLCIEAGATQLFDTIVETMTTGCNLTKEKT